MAFNDDWKNGPEAQAQQMQQQNTRKKVKSIAMTAVVVSALGAWLLPPNVTDKVIGVVKYFSLERACLREYKSVIVDPYSVYVESSRILKQSNELHNRFNRVLSKYPEAIEVTIKARNGFGAYKTDTIECPLSDGRVDEFKTLMWRFDR